MDNKTKSPFLSEESPENDFQQSTNTSDDQIQTKNLSEKEESSTDFQETDERKSEMSHTTASSKNSENNTDQQKQEGEVIEIKEEGKLLRRIITIIIILLLLALLGAGLFYIFQLKKNNSGPNEDINIQEDQSSIGVGDFEMEGDEFGADSVVVDN